MQALTESAAACDMARLNSLGDPSKAPQDPPAALQLALYGPIPPPRPPSMPNSPTAPPGECQVCTAPVCRSSLLSALPMLVGRTADRQYA
jgi:hypothetical protein